MPAQAPAQCGEPLGDLRLFVTVPGVAFRGCVCQQKRERLSVHFGCIGFVLKRYEIGRSGKNFSCIAKALPIGKSPLPFSQFVIVSFDFSVTSARSLFVRPVRLISATKLGYAIFCVPPFTFSDASEL